MKIEDVKNLTPYQDINNLLVLWSERLNTALGDNLTGFYLTGSLTYGDFVRERSDIDLIVIIKKPLNLDGLTLIKQLHTETRERFPIWADRIECSYLPINLLENVLPPKTTRPYLGGGKFYPDANFENEWIINNYLLYKYGIALIGPEFKSLVEPIDIKDVKRANIRILFEEGEPKINDSEWLSNSHHQSYLVLNLCRILYNVNMDDVGSKKVAATYVKTTYPEWKDLIETAESWSYGIEMNRQNDTIAFIKFIIEKVGEYVQK